MTAPILITGGTGTLGRLIVPLLHQAGHPVRTLGRTPHQHDLDGVEHITADINASTRDTGGGLDAALTGVHTVIHCAGSAKGDDDLARTLVRAARKAGVRHLVHISVVGADRVPVVSRVDRAMFGYFAAKHAAEHVITGSGIPWTILRATQFHDWIWNTLHQLAKLPIMTTWRGVRFQPVDTGEVAARLAELALAGPAGLVPDLGGPRVHRMEDLARDYLRATGRHRLVLPVKTPGTAAAAFRAGANLTTDALDQPTDQPTGRRTWQDHLTQRTTRQ
ncbi:NAD(P)H-binding protein [Nonomuraea sp. NN258]|uniref:SDR family oxidoreductase n=1 Tax=Nonomuraea antri TaxID=2730852 RepID=UPI001567DAF2|nr:NAD(P)H-binding protein [Nonomuraea antri]NRQ40783.1 NAD(P)H-binding protein [Nonomuraea antri]